MVFYILRRLLWVGVLLFAITLLTFVIFNVLPAGDPAALRAGRQPSAELIAAIREQLGLDDPYHVQFIRYIGQILPFVGGDGVNFGFSYQNNAEVLPQILHRLPATIFLTLGAVRGDAELDRPDIDAYGKKIFLQPDMLLKADIILERRSLASWLVNPLLGVRM